MFTLVGIMVHVNISSYTSISNGKGNLYALLYCNCQNKFFVKVSFNKRISGSVLCRIVGFHGMLQRA